MIGQVKTFHNEEELKDGINEKARIAMQNTLNKMLDMLGEFIRDDVYYSYSPIWYDRTYYLENNYRDMFETYFWNDFGKRLGGAIRVVKTLFPTHPTAFIHGSGNWKTNDIYSVLTLNSYLEIMNNPNLISSQNPFHFPTNDIMNKGQFWSDFLKWADENFIKIFKEEFENAE